MDLQKVRDAIFALRWAKEQLQMELEFNEGEETPIATVYEQVKSEAKEILLNGGIDHLGRLIKSVQDEIQSDKNEKAFIERRIKRKDTFLEDLLKASNDAIEELKKEGVISEDTIKGKCGYSLKAYTSITTKADNKMLKEKYHKDVMDVIRESGKFPVDLTVTLSASASLVENKKKMPEWYITTEVGRATFRTPRKDTGENEFEINEF